MQYTPTQRRSSISQNKALKLCLFGSVVFSLCGSLFVASAQDEVLQNVRSAASDGERRDFTYALRVSPRITYSDNVNLEGDGSENADGLLSVRLRGGGLLERAKFRGFLAGNVEVGTYFDPAENANGQSAYDRSIVDHRIRAAGTIQLIDNLLFTDISLGSEKRAISEQDKFTSQSLAGVGRQADVISYSISPYLKRRLRQDSTAELRYRYAEVLIDDGDSVDTVSNFLNDSKLNEVKFEYFSGKLLRKLTVGVLAEYRNITEQGSSVLPEVDFKQTALSTNVQVPLNRKVSLLGSVGYDDIETNSADFDDDDLSGGFWKAGLQLRPGRKTTIRAQAGERYDGGLVDIEAEYIFSNRLRLLANARRDFSTNAQLRQSGRDVLQSETLNYLEDLRQLNTLTNEELLERALQYENGLQDFTQRRTGLAAINSAQISAIANTRRDDFTLRVGIEETDFGFQQVDIQTIDFIWEHDFSRQLSSFSRLAYQHSDSSIGGSIDDCVRAVRTSVRGVGLTPAETVALCSDPTNFAADTHTASILAGLQYRFSERLSGFTQVAHTQRSSDNDALEYDENAVSVGVNLDY